MNGESRIDRVSYDIGDWLNCHFEEHYHLFTRSRGASRIAIPSVDGSACAMVEKFEPETRCRVVGKTFEVDIHIYLLMLESFLVNWESCSLIY